jgi:hypothetical protein
MIIYPQNFWNSGIATNWLSRTSGCGFALGMHAAESTWGLIFWQIESYQIEDVLHSSPTKLPRAKAVTRTHCPIQFHQQPKFCVVSAAAAADLEPIIGNTGKTPCYTRPLVSVRESGPSVLRFGLRPITIQLSTSFLQHGHILGNRISMQYILCVVKRESVCFSFTLTTR